MVNEDWIIHKWLLTTFDSKGNLPTSKNRPSNIRKMNPPTHPPTNPQWRKGLPNEGKLSLRWQGFHPPTEVGINDLTWDISWIHSLDFTSNLSFIHNHIKVAMAEPYSSLMGHTVQLLSPLLPSSFLAPSLFAHSLTQVSLSNLSSTPFLFLFFVYNFRPPTSRDPFPIKSEKWKLSLEITKKTQINIWVGSCSHLPYSTQIQNLRNLGAIAINNFAPQEISL